MAVELYDYLNDPVELENVAGRPENAALVKELSAKLDAGWRASTVGQCPTTTPPASSRKRLKN